MTDVMEIQRQIRNLAAQNEAVILAHTYQLPEVQEVADLVADSLALARESKKNKAKVILLCGVHFMAESACILAPEKIVLIPDPEAGCPMADMVTEANPIVRDYANKIMSTSQMIRYAGKSKAEEFIILTETGIKTPLERQNPSKRFYFPDRHIICPNMKKITLPKILAALSHRRYEVTVPEDFRNKAFRALDRMLDYSSQFRRCDRKTLINPCCFL